MDPTSLPNDLPIPIDDGACDHLPGVEMPAIELASTMGSPRVLDQVSSRWLVLYVYPRTGGPDIDLPDDWDLIPGARGCTPQSCAFRDHHSELRELDATVWGVSTQPMAEQVEFTERMHIPFPLLNDSALQLTQPPLQLPTFTAAGTTLYKRVTLIAEHGKIAKVFYPVFPPDRNAADVIEYLTSLV
ncbi:MAG: redoxin family protein [Acidimicrobiia bacterium]|nr:redoxin family protein [Acidimicrobiia bacterium]